MQSKVARIMGWPIIPGAIQSKLPNHPVGLLNWFGLMNMLAKQTSVKQEMFRELIVSGHPSWDTPGAVAIDAHCHQFNFGNDPVVDWEGAYLKWKGGSHVE
ncbi:hypothetical protein LSAT2_005055, partial [Lamellibrachia satsuma]